MVFWINNGARAPDDQRPRAGDSEDGSPARRGHGDAIVARPENLVPVDLRDYAVADVREAIDVVRAFDATAVLLYVIPPVRLPPWLKLDQHGHERDRLEAAKTQLGKLARTVGGDGECRVCARRPR